MATATKKAPAKKKGAKKKASSGGQARRPQAAARAGQGHAIINNILVPVDLGEESSWRQVLPIAVDYARSAGAKLHLMTVIPEIDFSLPAVRLPKNFNETRLREADKQLAAFIVERVPSELGASHSVRDGSIYREILAAAEQINADLIIMASHRPSLRSYLLGVNAARVVRHAKCSVYVIRERQPARG